MSEKINRVLLLTVNGAKGKCFSLTQRTKNWGIFFIFKELQERNCVLHGGEGIWKQEDTFYHRLRFLWIVSGIANWCSKTTSFFAFTKKRQNNCFAKVNLALGKLYHLNLTLVETAVTCLYFFQQLSKSDPLSAHLHFSLISSSSNLL